MRTNRIDSLVDTFTNQMLELRRQLVTEILLDVRLAVATRHRRRS